MTEFVMPRGTKRTGEIKILDAPYKYVYLDLYELLLICRAKPEFLADIEIIMNHHRRRKFSIMDYMVEHFITLKHLGGEYNYLFLIDDDKAFAACRVIIGGALKDGYISMVHIIPEYRGFKICSDMIKLLVKLTNETHQKVEYRLDVDPQNIPAIKCYERVGFKEESRTDENIKMKLNYADSD
jgi:ribosomal protein S18 acetylase RimI-like enzyme